MQYSIGFDVDARVRAAAATVPDDWWIGCLDNTTGNVLDGIECVELTDRLRSRLTGRKWPASMRVIVRGRRGVPR